MVIHTPKLEKSNDGNYVRISFDIESNNFNNVLWYEVENVYEDLLSQSCEEDRISCRDRRSPSSVPVPAEQPTRSVS